MANSIESKRGRLALMVAHCAGMVDLVALPVWVGNLINNYGFDAQKAGGLATLFLLGVVFASVVLAPQFLRISGRFVAGLGFGVSAIAFGLATRSTSFAELAALHALAGIATGAALSVTHGTIARSRNPHRLFAIVGIALGCFAVAFLALTPQLISVFGGAAMFMVFSAVMATGAVISAFEFPLPESEAKLEQQQSIKPKPIHKSVWFGILGISCMTVVQAMTFSFLDRVGADRGFERQAINGVLIALGLINLLPGALAALLERHWSARKVLIYGPIAQATLSATIMASPLFSPYAVAASIFAAVMIFTHTFAFGLLAKLDSSGRALAATPAMLMLGSAIGPILGGTLVKVYGYEAIGVAAACFAVMAVLCFSRLPIRFMNEAASRGALA